jgi:Domain of unknown function (DUF222)
MANQTLLAVDGAPVLAQDATLSQAMSNEQLEHEITTFAAHLSAATCRWLLMVAEFDRRRAYESWECLNTAQWLNVHAGISPSTGRQHVFVARSLLDLPRIRESFGRGELSYSRVRAVCRVAQPDDEDRWLQVAREATGSQLDRIVSDTIRAKRSSAPDQTERIEEHRSLTWFIDDDGVYHLQGKLPPEVGALLVKLVRRHMDQESRHPYEQRSVDSLATVLAAAAQARPQDGGLPAEPAVLLVVHQYPDGTSVLEDGPPIPPDLADRLADGAQEIVATHTQDEIRYSRRRRRPSVTMRRFLEARDRCCQFPGCAQRARLHAHHVRAYSDDGQTEVWNLVLLCPRHHGAIHHRGWTVTGNPNTMGLLFTGPAGQTFRIKEPRSGKADAIDESNVAAGVRPTSALHRPQGGGAPYDHHLAISALAARVDPTFN